MTSERAGGRTGGIAAISFPLFLACSGRSSGEPSSDWSAGSSPRWRSSSSRLRCSAPPPGLRRGAIRTWTCCSSSVGCHLIVSHSRARPRRVARGAAGETGIPVTVWSVSLFDLSPGHRTPMLVDALEDSIPVWCREDPLWPVPFTPADRLRCASALLERVSEGSEEFALALARGNADVANRRARDDIVRLSSALLLLRADPTTQIGGDTRSSVQRVWSSGTAIVRAERFSAGPPNPSDRKVATRTAGCRHRPAALKRLPPRSTTCAPASITGLTSSPAASR